MEQKKKQFSFLEFDKFLSQEIKNFFILFNKLIELQTTNLNKLIVRTKLATIFCS